MTTSPQETSTECECCEATLSSEPVWLEFDGSDGRYYAQGTVPRANSQGLFPFGACCARATLKRGGLMPDRKFR